MYRTGEMVVYDSIAHSNLPRHHKSTVMSFLDRNLGGLTKHASRFGSHLTAHRAGGMHHQGILRQNGESFIFGSALGIMNGASGGLDMGTNRNIPVDAGIAFASLLGAYFTRNYGISTEFTNLAASSFTVFGFRKGSALLGSAKSLTSKVTSAVHGEDDDPIVSAASEL
jgi:hypothetical protein